MKYRPIILVLAILAASSAATAQVPTRIVAVSGERAPGTFDGNLIARFRAFSDLPGSLGPVINNRGQVAFTAQLLAQSTVAVANLDANFDGNGDALLLPFVNQTNDRGLWSEGNGSLSLIAREGNQAAGTETDVYGNFLGTPVLNDQGVVAFAGNFDGESADVGLWSGTSGSLSLLARRGQKPAPSGVADEQFLSLGTPLLNNQNRVAFGGVLSGGDIDPVPGVNDRGIWAQQSDAALEARPRAGQIAPAVIEVGESLVHFSNFSTPRFNDAGELAFRGELVGNNVNTTNARGIWSQTGENSLRLVAREGRRAPGTDSVFDAMGIPSFNALGHTAFKARLAGVNTGSGIWSEDDAGLQLLARSGMTAPGTRTGVVFNSFSAPVLNNNNRVAFEATLAGVNVVDGFNDEGIWVERGDSFYLVARSGQQAPGTAEGIRFDDLNIALSGPAVNQSGQVAFISSLTGDVTENNDLGIFAMTPRGELVKVAQTGDSVEIAPGVFRTISDLKLRTGSGGGDGLGRSFNDRSQLVYWAAFTPEDNTTFGLEGVLVGNVTSSSSPYLLGDANGDGFVNRLDVALLAEWFGSFEFWEGDFDLDGKVTVNDLGLLQANYGIGPGQSPEVVPEPSSLVLALFAMVAMLNLRRRRRHNQNPTRQ